MMKKYLLSLIWICYLFSASSIIHSVVMGFFYETVDVLHSCHWETFSSSSDGEEMNTQQFPSSKWLQWCCCELVFSGGHFPSSPDVKEYPKSFTSLLFPFSLPLSKEVVYQQFHTTHPPGRIVDIKYQHFSDLIGIIVNLA